MNSKEETDVMHEKLNLVKYDINDIKNLIYTIRGKQVMLDSDVAMLYHYKTKRINETVGRNKERFPENFCFQLTNFEFENLRFQIGTSSPREKMNRSQIATASIIDNKKRNKSKLPYVFTEQGIAMLSRIVKK